MGSFTVVLQKSTKSVNFPSEAGVDHDNSRLHLSCTRLRSWIYLSEGGATSPSTVKGVEVVEGVEAVAVPAVMEEEVLALGVWRHSSSSSHIGSRSSSTTGGRTSLHIPSFSRNLVGVSHVQDLGIGTFFPLHERFATCTDGATGAPLAAFHMEQGSCLSSLRAKSPRVAGQVNQMVCHRLVSRLPASLATLTHSLAPLCTPCVKGQQHAAPHSSVFPPTMAPLQTVHIDVWGYSPKADVPDVLEPWLLAVCAQQGHLVLRLYLDHCGTNDFSPLPHLYSSLLSHHPLSSPLPPPPSLLPHRPALVQLRRVWAIGVPGLVVMALGVQAPPVEDTATSSQRPRPASTSNFPSHPQFPPCSPLQPAIAESRVVPTGGTGGAWGVGVGAGVSISSGGARAGSGDTGAEGATTGGPGGPGGRARGTSLGSAGYGGVGAGDTNSGAPTQPATGCLKRQQHLQ
ncbi:unnamed protein product [Closterium sp. NIES-53]